jgi:hypothetical protein
MLATQQGEHWVGEEFLYELKAGPAGGLRRPPARHRHGGRRELASPSMLVMRHFAGEVSRRPMRHDQ